MSQKVEQIVQDTFSQMACNIFDSFCLEKCSMETGNQKRCKMDKSLKLNGCAQNVSELPETIEIIYYSMLDEISNTDEKNTNDVLAYDMYHDSKLLDFKKIVKKIGKGISNIYKNCDSGEDSQNRIKNQCRELLKKEIPESKIFDMYYYKMYHRWYDEKFYEYFAEIVDNSDKMIFALVSDDILEDKFNKIMEMLLNEKEEVYRRTYTIDENIPWVNHVIMEYSISRELFNSYVYELVPIILLDGMDKYLSKLNKYEMYGKLHNQELPIMYVDHASKMMKISQYKKLDLTSNGSSHDKKTINTYYPKILEYAGYSCAETTKFEIYTALKYDKKKIYFPKVILDQFMFIVDSYIDNSSSFNKYIKSVEKVSNNQNNRVIGSENKQESPKIPSRLIGIDNFEQVEIFANLHYIITQMFLISCNKVNFKAFYLTSLKSEGVMEILNLYKFHRKIDDIKSHGSDEEVLNLD